MPKSIEKLVVIVVLGLFVSLAANVANGQDPGLSVQDKHFSVGKTLGMFSGSGDPLCSFNATSNQWIELKILSTSQSPYRDSGIHEAIFRINSNEHGEIITLRTYDSLNQTVNLPYDDSYTITVAKHPFYATVTVKGAIDLYHNQTSVSLDDYLLENQVYNVSSVPLSFSINNQYSWLGYSLYEFANMTIAGNTTVTGLSAGYHSLVVYANDTFGAMAKSQTLNFTIKEPEISLTTIIAPIIILFIVSVGLVVYFRRKN